jgi:O-antigen/teichoic acid export membrane protein
MYYLKNHKNISTNVGSLSINAIVNILFIKYFIEFFGVTQFSNYIFILTFAGFVSVFSNMLTGALNRYITMTGKADGSNANLNYFDNAVFLLFSVSFFILIFLNSYFILFNANIDFVFLNFVFISLVLNQYASLYTVSCFVTENFVYRNVISILAKVLFFIVFLVMSISFNEPRYILVAYFSESIFKLFFYHYNFNKVFSGYNYKFNRFSSLVIRKIVYLSGWITMIYLSTFLMRASLISFSEWIGSDKLVATTGIVVQVIQVVSSILTSTSVVTSPYIYKFIKSNKPSVYVTIKKYCQINSAMLILGSLFFYLTGSDLLVFWISDLYYDGLDNIIYLSFVYAFALSLGVPISVYYAAVDDIKKYAVFSLLAVVMSIFLIILLQKLSFNTNFLLSSIGVLVFFELFKNLYYLVQIKGALNAQSS